MRQKKKKKQIFILNAFAFIFCLGESKKKLTKKTNGKLISWCDRMDFCE